MALQARITLNDLKDMSFVTLANILDCMNPVKEHQPTQAEIDMIV